MRIYLIRHGESETNFKKCWCGWMDVPLTEKGREDAGRAKNILQSVSFDKVYTSDLCRAVETAEIALPGYELETWPLLREVNVGSIAGKPLLSISEEQRLRASQNGYTEFDGESKDEFNARIYQVMQELESSPYDTVALFTHAGFLCGMLDTVLGMRLPRKNICCNNCTIAIFEYDGERWLLHSWINAL